MQNDRWNRKNPPQCCNTGAGNGKQPEKHDFLSTSTAEDGQGQVKIADLLSHGKNNAVTLQYLVNMTGFDSRTVRRMIHLERKAGSMIVSDNVHGYFLPEDVEDLRRFSRSMNHRAAEILSIARKAENALADMEGQSMIEGF